MNKLLNIQKGTEAHRGGCRGVIEAISTPVLSSGECAALTEQVEAKCLAQSSSGVHSS